VPEQPKVRVGQVWESCDKRELPTPWGGRKGGQKRVRVQRIVVDGTRRYADCELVNAEPGERKATRIRIDRFRPTSTGYKLVKDIPAEAATG
jgi:hypothetical protein